MGFAHLISNENRKYAGFGFVGIIIASYVSTYYVSI